MRSLLFPAVLLLGATGADARSPSTFQLPPDPDATPTSRPQAEGPVDTEGNTRSAPRVIGSPTPSPSPTQSAPAPRPSAPASPAQTASPTPRPSPSGNTRALPTTERSVATREVLSREETQPSAPERTQAESAAPQATPEETASAPVGSQAEPLAQRDPEDGEADTTPPAREVARPADTKASLPWALLAAGLVGLLALGAILFALLRRRRSTRPDKSEPAPIAAAPIIETTEPVAARPAQAGALDIEVQAMTLSRSLMNASISYRISIVNRGRAVEGLAIHGDVTTAHGRAATEQQLADIGQTFPELHTLPRLDMGQRTTLRGELRLPLREVRPLRQGDVPVFVPLLRLTMRAANMDPRAFTYVIGTKSTQKSSRPSPFRLDGPPRSYDQLTTRAVA
ncbi:hypothetical protein [Alteriqipengyuania sp. 357]